MHRLVHDPRISSRPKEVKTLVWLHFPHLDILPRHLLVNGFDPRGSSKPLFAGEAGIRDGMGELTT
jgi:hypothetical protein